MESRHHKVEEHQVDRGVIAEKFSQRTFSARTRRDLIAARFKVELERVANKELVVDYEDMC